MGVEMFQSIDRIRFSKTGSVALAALFLAACTQQPAQEEESHFRLTATVQDLMDAQIDPAADFLWQSVATIVNEAGIEDRRPRTGEEWEAVRFAALRLVEGTNLLMMEGRRVAAEGMTIEDAHLAGVLTPGEIQQEMETTWPAFVAYAQALHDAGMESLRAIAARDAEALLNSGETIDVACEGCHRTYWYPNAALPVPASAAAEPQP